ncbi:MAG: hypothetical protein ACYTG6_10775, partial [Planctomycetota bacterium]
SLQRFAVSFGLAALTASIVFLYAGNRALEERVRFLESEPAAREPVAPGPETPVLSGTAVHREVTGLREDVAALAERVSATETRVGDASRSGAEGAPAGALDLSSPAFDEAVRDVVLDLTGDVAFRSRLGLDGSSSLGKDPPFAKLAEALKLDGVQEEALREEIGDLQASLLDVLQTPRPDGIVPLEEIQRAESLPEHDPERAAIFFRLFSKQVPGTEETYLQRAIALTRGFRERVVRHLGREQVEIFQSLDVNYFEVKLD